jgi:hypothetical protein
MTTELDKKTASIADQIVDEFIRLGVSTDDDPCSGLMTRIPNVVTDICLVDIYDDHANGFYDGEKVLAHLKQLGYSTFESIWQELAAFEA